MIALTGARGMTGQHMKALLAHNDIECLEVNRDLWDLTQWPEMAQLDEWFGNAEAVFHFGAMVPSNAGSRDMSGAYDEVGRLFDANIRSVQALAQWATIREKPLVFLSGTTVYKDPHQLNIAEDAEKVVCGFGGFYGYTKWMAENLLEHYRAQGLKLVTLRPSSIYGTGMTTDRLLANFLNKAENGETLTVTTPVENCLNLIHCSDVARAALSAYQQQAWGIYNIAGAKNVRFQEMAEQAIATAGNGQLTVKDSDNPANPFTRYDLDFSKATSAFGYRPQVDLAQGMQAMKDDKLLCLD